MDLDEFIEAVVRLSLHDAGTEGGEGSAPQDSKALACKHFLENELVPMFERKSEATVRKELIKPSVRQLLGKHINALELVYKYYALKNDFAEAKKKKLEECIQGELQSAKDHKHANRLPWRHPPVWVSEPKRLGGAKATLCGL